MSFPRRRLRGSFSGIDGDLRATLGLLQGPFKWIEIENLPSPGNGRRIFCLLVCLIVVRFLNRIYLLLIRFFVCVLAFDSVCCIEEERERVEKGIIKGFDYFSSFPLLVVFPFPSLPHFTPPGSLLERLPLQFGNTGNNP